MIVSLLQPTVCGWDVPTNQRGAGAIDLFQVFVGDVVKQAKVVEREVGAVRA
jgi:hypothetical protein